MENLPQMEVRMKVKEYLNQAYRLKQRIKLYQHRLEELRLLSSSISSPSFEQSYNPNRNTEAPFIRTLMKISDLEEKITNEVNKLLQIEDDIQRIIESVENVDEELVLKYRYIMGYTWSEISSKLHASRSSVIRWHESALAKLDVY